MKTIDRCRALAAARVLKDLGADVAEVRVDGKLISPETARKVEARELAAVPHDLPRVARWADAKIDKLKAARAERQQHKDHAPADAIDEPHTPGRLERFARALIDKGTGPVTYRATVEVKLKSCGVERFVVDITDRRMTYYLRLLTLFTDVVVTTPMLPFMNVLTLEPIAVLSAAAAIVAWARRDTPLKSVLGWLAAREAGLGVVGELDPIGNIIGAAALMTDLGATKRFLEAPSVAAMNQLAPARPPVPAAAA